MNSWILSIGSSSPRNLPLLPAADNDATAIFHLLSSYWNSPAEHSILLLGKDVTTSTLQTLLNELLLKRAAPNDRLFIYLSGHVDPNVRDVTGSLVTHDHDPKQRNFGLNLRTLRYLVEDSPAHYVIVVIDGCMAGVIAQGDRALIPHWFYFTSGELDSDVATKLFVTAVSSGVATYAKRSHTYSDFTNVLIDILTSEETLRSGLTTSRFFDQVSAATASLGLAPPVKTGVEVGTSWLLRPNTTAKTTEFKPENQLPVWVQQLLQETKSQNNYPIPGDNSAFVRDNNYPDGSQLTIGQEIDKSWRIRNTGSETWRNRFLRITGNSRGLGRIHAPLLTPLPLTAPGKEIDIEITVRMPVHPGSVYVEFRMVDATGNMTFPHKRGLYIAVDVIDPETK